MHIFGDSNKSLHFFALFISLLFLITVYESVYRVFNKRAAIISLLLVATHVSFFVQSSFVLLEMLVAYLSFLSIWLYLKQKYLLATLSLTALMLTKESGAVAVFVIGLHAFFSLFNSGITFEQRLKRLVPPAVACVAILLFFLLQKHRYGWYVLPLYTQTIQTTWNAIWYRFATGCVSVTFTEGAEHLLFFALIVCAILVIIKQRTKQSFALLCLIVPAVIGYYYIDVHRIEDLNFPTPSVITFVLFVVFYFLSLLAYSSKAFYDTAEQRKFVWLLGSFVFAYMAFSSFAYFIPRYLLASIVPDLVLLGIFADMLIRNSYKMLYYPMLIVVAVAGYYSFTRSAGWADSEMGFFSGLKTQTGIVEYLERSNAYDKHIATFSFLDREHLQNKDCGFLTQGRAFSHVGYYINDSTDLVIFDNIEPDERYNSVVKDTNFHLVYRINIRDVWCEVYQVGHSQSKNTIAAQ